MYSYSISKKLVLTALLGASVSVSATQEDAANSHSTQADSALSDTAKVDSVKLDEAAQATAALIAATLSQHNDTKEDKIDIAHGESEVKSEPSPAPIDETAEVQTSEPIAEHSSELIAETSAEPISEQSDIDETKPAAELSAKADTIKASSDVEEIAQAKPALPVAAMPAPKPAPAAAIASSAGMSSQMNTQSCPANFYDVKLPKDGKLCQVFAADLPASMILFVPQTPEQVIEFYQQDSANFSTSRQVKDRFMLQSTDKNKTVIISADGQGTQVDILVKI